MIDRMYFRRETICNSSELDSGQCDIQHGATNLTYSKGGGEGEARARHIDLWFPMCTIYKLQHHYIDSAIARLVEVCDSGSNIL